MDEVWNQEEQKFRDQEELFDDIYKKMEDPISQYLEIFSI